MLMARRPYIARWGGWGVESHDVQKNQGHRNWWGKTSRMRPETGTRQGLAQLTRGPCIVIRRIDIATTCTMSDGQ